MELSRIPADQIVVVQYERLFAIAEARELKEAGFGKRRVACVMPGEWRLPAASYRDFQCLAAAVPEDYVGMVRSRDGNNQPLGLSL